MQNHRLPQRLSRARLIAGAGAAFALGPQLLFAQPLEKVRFGGVPTDDLTPLFYALKNGLYQKAGLDVEFMPASSGTAATTAVVSGAYELGKGSLLASLIAYLKGLPIKLVANGALWDPKNPFTQIMVAADAPIRKAADLNGKTGSSPGLGDLGQLGIVTWVDKNGGDSKTMKWLEIPNSAAFEAVAQHRIDVTTVNEPQLHAALDSGRFRALGGLEAIADRFSITVYFANGEFAAKRPDLARRFTRVTYEAAAYTNAHKAETAPMMAEITKIPVATFSKMYRVDGATTSDPGLVQSALETAVRYKHVERSFPVKDAFLS
jgi:NitT/TauT family transport system substrate-binding protein